MSLFQIFWLGNIHFFIEVIIVIITIALSWLHLDALKVHFSLPFFLRGMSFASFVPYLIVHALSLDLGGWSNLPPILAAAGVVVFIVSWALQRSPGKPADVARKIYSGLPIAFGLVTNAPGSELAEWIFVGLLFVLTALIAYRYFVHVEINLRGLSIGLILVLLSTVFGLFALPTLSGVYSYLEHGLRLAGFVFIAAWLWQYLSFRVQEQLLLVFVVSALLMSVILTLTFSGILIKDISNETKENLATNARVFDHTIESIKRQALSAAIVVASDEDLETDIRRGDFEGMVERGQTLMQELSTAFLVITDPEGKVLARVHDPKAKGDVIKKESAVAKALVGERVVTVETGATEKLSVRAAAPVKADGKTIGVIVTGFHFDDAFVAGFKKAANLDFNVLELKDGAAIRIATAEADLLNTRETNIDVISAVSAGNEFVGEINIISRPSIAAYRPIKNALGDTVGAFEVAIPQAALLQTFNRTNTLNFYISTITMLVIVIPLYWLTKHIIKQISA